MLKNFFQKKQKLIKFSFIINCEKKFIIYIYYYKFIDYIKLCYRIVQSVYIFKSFRH